MPSAFCLPAQRQRDWQQHDQIYTAYQHFMRQLYSDWSVRTENPWEADLFYVPALTYFYSSELPGRPASAVASCLPLLFSQRHCVSNRFAPAPFQATWAPSSGRTTCGWCRTT